ncbi:MAG: 1-acyl-sn-glycerol-3-phosphate acyltransferase [Alphaproteobacteria bacterium]|nr:1-acyl-sn-glycerol-3-phosphate acyltransferase [Alphaproteobacteria bacterium]
MISTLRAALKMAAFVVLCLLIVPLQTLLLLFYKGRYAYILPHLWHKGVSAIFGISYEMQGQPVTKQQVMYLSNHLSYLDIPLLGGIICYSAFVAKSEVAGWPVFGYLSKLQQTVFIQRSRAAAAKEVTTLDDMLTSGNNLTIFPEGTSTDGQRVIPFKSSLFAIPLQEKFKDLMIQPITLSIVTANGRKPETQETRDLYAWHIDMTTPLGAHLWRFAKTSGARIQVVFHPPLRSGDFFDRKELARTCFETVCKGLDLQAAA